MNFTNIELQQIEEFRNVKPTKIIAKRLEKIAKTHFYGATHTQHCFCAQSERDNYKIWFYETLNNMNTNDSSITE